MSSERRLSLVACLAAAASFVAAGGRTADQRFYPDDPLRVDRDTVHDASASTEQRLSEAVDLFENSLAPRPTGDPGRALNVNTLDEAPDSSWFTNRIGQRPMSVEEIVRGPDTFGRLEVAEWVVTGGKGPAGFQPGFRAADARFPGQQFQLEVDLERHAELASGAEIIGTAFYHAIGYNVVDIYLVDVDPSKIRIADTATERDASGRRAYTQRDLDLVFEQAARNPDGTYRMTAGRFVEGDPRGPFKHFGTRPDDPNDIFPHEHRRELRGNRVFCAWLNHDDSRAPNTLDMLVGPDGGKWIKHYMFDFGSILGSSPERWWSGQAYMLERGGSLWSLLSLGLPVRHWQRVNDPRRLPMAVGRLGSEGFDPATWKPEYPNRAFDNMRADDAFWAARIVSRFSDDAIRAVVAKAKYRDPLVTDYIASALIERRNRIRQTWLTVVNPIVEPMLAADGSFTFENAAVAAGVATAPAEYRLSWSRFDNVADARVGASHDVMSAGAGSIAPEAVLRGSAFVTVAIETRHPGFPRWAAPVHVYFRRTSTGWEAVGIDRQLPEG